MQASESGYDTLHYHWFRPPEACIVTMCHADQQTKRKGGVSSYNTMQITTSSLIEQTN
jgi:hypothetical protein